MNEMMKNSLPVANVSEVSFLPSWLLWVIGILVVLALFFFVVLPVYRKVQRKRLKVQETSEIKKDLMIWHHLSQLVRGGSEHQKAKQALSGQIIAIEQSFKQGMHMLSLHNRKMYEQPWFVLLGEPFSGKSLLLRNSELEMISSAEEEAVGDEEKKEMALRFWLGAKAVVCDINGRVFFDRWLNGSSAEWNYICKLLRRKRFKRPLDGIIVTIPADALLADDEVLSQKKAVLMTTEIGQLLHTVGMNLPCYVIVTKTDMIDGFDEYVMGINEDLRSQIFGWVNEDGIYQADSFRAFWKNLIIRLHSGCEKSMLSKNVATKLSSLSNRMEITGKIYLFPENFNGLYKNLSIYLRALFGEGNFHGADNAVLEGVFFTSAKDGNVTLSPSFARLCEKKVDEAPLSHEPNPHFRPFFIRDLLNKIVFRRSDNAFFTVREKVKRNIPKYFLCGVMIAIGIIWLSAACFEGNALKSSLAMQTEYYTTLSDMLGKGEVFSSALIKQNKDGKYELDSDPIKNEKISRLQFFFELFADREAPNEAPFGFKAAALSVFGEHNIGYSKKAFIFNQMIGTMLRMPVIHAVGDKITVSGTDSELTRIKRSAIGSFTALNTVKEEDYSSIIVSDEFDLKMMLAYVLPSISNDITNLVTSFLPRYDKKYSNTMDPLYIHSEEFITAQEIGLKSIIGAWKALKAYPESMYVKIRSMIRLSDKIRQRDIVLSDMTERANRIFDGNELKDVLKQWNTLVIDQVQDIAEMNILFDEIQSALPPHFNDKGYKNKKNVLADQSFLYGNVSINLLLRYYSKKYETLLHDDFDFANERAGQFITANWNPEEWRKVIKNEEKKTVSLLAAEIDSLYSNINSLRGTPLYQWQLTEKQGASDYLYNILGKFYLQAIKAKALSEEEIAKNDFKTNWLKTQQMIKDMFDSYDAAVRPYSENEEIMRMAGNIRKMLLLQAQSQRYDILRREIERLPANKAEMDNFVAENSQEKNVFDFSAELALEVLGEFSYTEKYNPKTVKQVLENVFAIATSFLRNKKEQSAVFVNDGEYYQEKLKTFERYLESFIDYWGNYPDQVYVDLSSWEEFKRRAGTMKAFKINSLLQAIYSECLNILKGIDDTALSEEIKKEKEKYIALINDKLKMLTALFTNAGQKTLNAWAELPDDEQAAWEHLTSLTEKELQSSLFNMKTQGERARIGWWNDFTDNAVALLKKENENRLKKNSSGLLNLSGGFPLCRDCGTGKTVTPKQMKEIKRLLKAVVEEKAADGQKEQEKPLFDKHLSLFADKESLDWAENVLKITSVLTDEKNPLIWTLYQAPVDIQTGLLSGNEIAAVNRFRYVEIKTDALKTAKRFGTSSSKETVIAQGRAANSITLKFYKSSADAEPEAQLRLGDYWSVFRIYLKTGGYTDPQTNRLYVPLTVKDKAGVKYVYVLGVKMNRPLLKSDEWPSKQNWRQAVAAVKNVSAEQ